MRALPSLSVFTPENTFSDQRQVIPQLLKAVLFQDGVRLRADAWCSDPGKVRRMSPRAQQGIIELMAALAA